MKKEHGDIESETEENQRILLKNYMKQELKNNEGDPQDTKQIRKVCIGDFILFEGFI